MHSSNVFARRAGPDRSVDGLTMTVCSGLPEFCVGSRQVIEGIGGPPVVWDRAAAPNRRRYNDPGRGKRQAVANKLFVSMREEYALRRSLQEVTGKAAKYRLTQSCVTVSARNKENL